MEDLRDAVDSFRVAMADARDAIRAAKDTALAYKEQTERALSTAGRFRDQAKDALSLANDWQLQYRKLLKERTDTRRKVLEYAIQLEREQMAYSRNETRDHHLLRIANERLNGVYGCMPSLFDMPQHECIDMVRRLAATEAAE